MIYAYGAGAAIIVCCSFLAFGALVLLGALSKKFGKQEDDAARRSRELRLPMKRWQR